jgi:type II secretory ATPase GspE/PulE/Tfp pilus assembly ATPase PilB-like protein
VEAALHAWPALGALLVRDGVVSKGELAAVLARQRIAGEQRISGRRLGELLVERGLVTRTQVARVLAEQYELPFVELDGSEVNLHAAMLLSEELARRLSALPISRLPDDSILVAVADPTSALFSDDLRRVLGVPLRFAVAAPEKIDAAITYAHQRLEEGATAPTDEREHESTFRVERSALPAWPALGALLIRDGRVSEEELEAVVGQQRIAGSKRLGELLVEHGLVTRDQVARLLAEQYELPFVELTESAEKRGAAALLPGWLARRYSALPVRVFPDGSLLVAVSDPTTALHTDGLRAAAGIPLHFAVAPPDAIAAAIARAYEDAPGELDDEAAALESAVVEMPDNQDDDARGAAAGADPDEAPDTEDFAHSEAEDPPGPNVEGEFVETTVPEDSAALAWIDDIVVTPLLEEPTAPVEAEGLADFPPLDVVAEQNADTSVVDEPDETADDEIAAVSATDEVEEAIEHALSLGASDIHFTPQAHAVVVRARIDGVMRELGTIPSSKKSEVAARLKLLGQLDSEEWRAPQDGRVEIGAGQDTVDLRIVVVPTKHGEKVTLHLLHQASAPRSLAELGMAPESEDALRRAILRPSGVVLVCGPTGSGCTTTLYAALQELNTPERTLATIEDPVEHLMPGIDQTEVDPVAGLTLASGLRAILGSDPNVILVGEISDEESAQVAVRAAMTGCLVLSAVHVESAAAAIERLTYLGVEPGLLGATLTCVIAQRLARRICTECRESYYATQSDVAELARPQDELGRRLLVRGTGCATCGGTGYHGRVALFEVLSLTREVQELIGRRSSIAEIERAAIGLGMRTLRDHGIRLCLEGLTTAAEIRRVIGDREQDASGPSAPPEDPARATGPVREIAPA